MLDPTNTVVVANPAAGAGRVGSRRADLEETLAEELGNVRILYTERQGHAAELAERAIERGARTILSLGGDGTHSEVTNGIMRSGAEPGTITLGILPAGTGGDFRRLLRRSGSVREAAASLREASSTPIDVGSVRLTDEHGAPHERYFLNIASFGIGGLVDRLVNETPKLFGGRVSFLVGTLRSLARYKPARVRLWVDDELVGEHEVTNICVCNGRFAGGGMMFAPDARLSDGLFDVVTIEHAPFLETASMTATIYRGEHLRSRRVHVTRGKVVRAEAMTDAPGYMDVDGEAPGFLPAELRVLPKAIRLLDARPEVL